MLEILETKYGDIIFFWKSSKTVYIDIFYIKQQKRKAKLIFIQKYTPIYKEVDLKSG